MLRFFTFTSKQFHTEGNTLVLDGVRRGSYASHAEEFGPMLPAPSTRWLAAQYVALDAMLTCAVALRKRGMVRRIARQMVVLDGMLTASIASHAQGRQPGSLDW